ncbi:MAG: DNA-binding protein [Candidatus Omnitrophota bacterium]
MRKYLIFYFFILSFAFLSLPSTAYAAPLSSDELISNAKGYDGEPVSFAGEVIGDIMFRGAHAWVNINDGESAIGVWMPGELAKKVRFTGSYKFIGDWVEITGVFHRACPEHGGDLDIHAQSIDKISTGRQKTEKFNNEKKNLALFLLGILGLVWILKLLK